MKQYEDGERAFKQRRYKDAIDLFLSADRTVHNPAFAFNVSLAYEEMGDVAAALRWAREYLVRAPSAGNRAETEERIRRFERRLQEKGVQQLTVRSEPSGATLTIDDRPVGVTPWTGELVPGAHGLTLSLRGYDDKQQQVELATDRSLDAMVTLEPSRAVSPPPAPPPPAPRPAPRRPVPRDAGSPTVQPWTISALAAGVAGIGVGVGLEIARANAEEDALSAPTQVEAAEAVDRMESMQLGSRIAFGVGGGLLLLGGILLIVDLTAEPEPNAPAAASCRSGVCGATLRF
jgi:hypothetical protein